MKNNNNGYVIGSLIGALVLFLFASVVYMSILEGADQTDWPSAYISSSEGSGTGDGSLSNPYKSSKEINWLTGGDNSVADCITSGTQVNIYWKRGDTFNENCVPLAEGSTTAIIYQAAYGSGDKPKLQYSYDTSDVGIDWTNMAGDVWWTNWTAPSTTGSNLIANGTFEANTVGWTMVTGSPAVATLTRTNDVGNGQGGSDYYMTMAITTQGNNYTDVLLKSPEVNFEQGKSYLLTYYAKASTADDQLPPQSSGLAHPGVFYGLEPEHTQSYTTGWVQRSYYFTSPYDSTWGSDPGALMRWPMGNDAADDGPDSGTDVYIDTVTLHELESTGGIIYGDPGMLIFNGGGTYGNKKDSIGSFTSQGDFFWNDLTSKISLNSPGGDPDTYYSDIDVAISQVIMDLNDISYMEFENLHFKWTGHSGIYADNQSWTAGAKSATPYSNIKVTNCDFSEIGGVWGAGFNCDVRGGGGALFWGDQTDITFTHNRGWELYDNLVSPQCNEAGNTDEITNILIAWNIAWNCELPIVVWLTNGDVIDGIDILNNSIVYSGYQASHDDRPDNERACGIRIGPTTSTTTVGQYLIANNVIAYTTGANDSLMEVDETTRGNATDMVFDSNHFYQLAAGASGISTVIMGEEYTYGDIGDWFTSAGAVNCNTGDPKLYNADDGDVRPLPQSPLKDAGTDSAYSEAVTDYAGRDITDASGDKIDDMPIGAYKWIDLSGSLNSSLGIGM